MHNYFNEKALGNFASYLKERCLTIAVAESVTAGFLQAALGSIENASEFFQGGITAYNLGQKCRHLSVEPIYAEQCNCVSNKVAEQMAIEVCRLFCSQWGVGITGYASPVPEASNKLYAHVAIAFSGKVMISKKISSRKEPGLSTQLFFVNETISLLQKCVSGKTSGRKK